MSDRPFWEFAGTMLQKREARAGTSFQCLEGGAGRRDGGMQWNDFFKASQPQYLFHVPACAGDSKFSTRILHLRSRHHEDANTRAIDLRDVGYIENDLPLLVAHQVFGSIPVACSRGQW
jgi:hypothetical protein